MSPTRALVAVAVAAVLAVVAYFVLRPPGGGAADTGPLLGFDPAAAVAITVTRPDGRVEAVRRGERAGEWVVTLPKAGGADEWPARASNARGALRILSNIVPASAAEAGASLGPGATVVAVSTREASGISIWAMMLDGRVLGGRVLARRVQPGEGPAVWVDAELAEMLVRAGPREWRETAAFSAVGEASRITLKSPAGTIALGRVQGRWALREPVTAEAEPEAVQRLAGGLAAVEITDFLDGGAPAGAGLDAGGGGPAVVLETDERDPATGRSSTLTTALRLGQQADLAGKTIFAMLSRPGVGERAVIVSAEPLAGLANDPAAYVARRAVSTPAGDIGAVRVGGTGGAGGVGGRRFTRTLQGWQSAAAGGAGVPALPDDARAVEALLKLLTETPADGVSVEQAGEPDGIEVELTGISGEPVALLSVGGPAAPGGEAGGMVVRAGAVTRRYGAAHAAGVWPWLSRE